jgi:hypothetical protein
MSTLTAGNVTVSCSLSADTSGNLVFQSGGNVTAMTIDSSQNVGIGTSSPLSVFDVVVGASGARRLLVNYDDTLITVKGASNTAAPEALRLVADNIRFNTGTTGSGTERARIDSSGRVLINTTTADNNYQVKIDGNAAARSPLRCSMDSTSNVTQVGFFNPNGAVGSISTSGSATAYNTSSDYRLKESITPMTGALAKVSLLKPVTYKWKVDGSDGQGFIAHELAEVEAGCVNGEKDAVDAEGNPIYQGIDTSFLVATLTAAIQEQQQMIEELKAKVAALEAA